jgi:hypothetical protein
MQLESRPSHQPPPVLARERALPISKYFQLCLDASRRLQPDESALEDGEESAMPAWLSGGVHLHVVSDSKTHARYRLSQSDRSSRTSG